MTRKKPIIGLCGGIGAGKSQVAAEFARLGCRVISSDALNHEVLRRPDVAATLRAWWGPDVLDANGQVDRARVAEIVFRQGEQKRRLEGLVYPLIAELRSSKITDANGDLAVKAIILDSPLLFESNLDRLCDSIVFIDTPREQRLARLGQTRGWTAQELHERERWQMPLAEKRARSAFVVDNAGAPERLGAQVADILASILSRPTTQG